MNRELHVFGCSFTDYPQWPVWSDWLGVAFGKNRYFKNATGGLGNRGIFHRVSEYLTDYASSQDVVVIQWGSCAREDKFKDIENFYEQCGCIANTFCYDDEYIRKNFSFKQSLYETFNYIKLTKQVLKLKKINYVMTYMLDPTIEPFLGEPGFNAHNEYISVEEMDNLSPMMRKLKRLSVKNFTDQCMTMHQMDNPAVVYSFADPDGKIIREGHPSPKQGYLFMKEQILPMLPFIDYKETQELLDLVDQWEEYAKIEKPCEQKSHLEPEIWPVAKRYNNKHISLQSKYYGNIYNKNI